MGEQQAAEARARGEQNSLARAVAGHQAADAEPAPGRGDVAAPREARVPTAFHYTTAGGLVGIATSHCLWASSPLGLNDVSELTYGAAMLERLFAARTRVSDRERYVRASTFDAGGLRVMSEDLYILSASEDPDSLNQWQGYAGQQGYALGIDTEAWLAISGRSTTEVATDDDSATALPIRWHRVIYDVSEQEEVLKELLELRMSDLPRMTSAEALEAHALRTARDFGETIARFKHPAFAPEREVRLIVRRPAEVEEQFRAGRFGIVPYVEVATHGGATDSARFDRRRTLLPLVSVTCGPVNETERPLGQEAIARLMAAKGYTVDVLASAAPYRF